MIGFWRRWRQRRATERRRREARLRAEIDEELAFHLEMRARSNRRAGMDEGEARRAALDSFGDPSSVRAEGVAILAASRNHRSPLRDPAALIDDARIGLRKIAREPLLAAVIVAVVALGVATNATIFSTLETVVLQPLDFPEPDRLVRLYSRDLERGIEQMGVSPADFRDWREQSETLAALALESGVRLRLASEEPRRVTGGTVTEEFFEVIGAKPIEGRLFSRQEWTERAPVMVITDRFWRQELGGEEGVVGSTLLLDRRPYSIVGIIPQPGLPFSSNSYWIPWTRDESEDRGNRVFNAFGRLRADVGLAAARAELAGIGARLADEYPATNEGIGVRLLSLHDDQLGGDRRRSLMLLFGAGALLLLLACANGAGLLLARAARMGHEIAVRAALGAHRGRIVRQLLVENGLLIVGAGLVSLPLTAWGIGLVRWISPTSTPRIEQLGLDGWALTYILGITAVAGLAAGLVGSWGGARPELVQVMSADALGHTGSPGRMRARKLLVVVETALAVLLMIGAGLLTRSFLNAEGAERGYRPDNLLVTRITPWSIDFGEQSQRRELFTTVLERARSLPGVDAAALTASIPEGPGFSLTRLRGHGPDPDEEIVVERQRVSGGYFETMEIPLLRGRGLRTRIDPDSSPEIVISESLARRLWPDADALGKTLPMGSDWRVVGIAGDIRYGSKREPRPTIYWHFEQQSVGSLYLVLRTDDPPSRLAGAVRRMIWSVDPEMPLDFVTSVEQRIAQNLAADRFRMRVLGSLALIAALLACLGIYGAMVQWVTQRVPEIGVRMAIGADRGAVSRMVTLEGMKLATAGVALGLAAAAGLTRFLGSVLYEVSATDPWTFVAYPACLLLTALLACALPARRATRVEALTTLRS